MFNNRSFHHGIFLVVLLSGIAHAAVKINTAVPVANVDERYLSFTIDSAQLVGGKWWSRDSTARIHPYSFNRPQLDMLVHALSPAYFRIGGTESDRISYNMNNTLRQTTVTDTLTAGEWDAAMDFSKRLGLKVLFTLNAEPSSRDFQGNWDSTNFETLLQHATSRQDPVDVWEFGNELNAYPLFFGIFHFVGAGSYVNGLNHLREILNRVAPGAKIAGPSPIYLPGLGEPFHTLSRVLNADKNHALDIVSWHYYPSQSARCGILNRMATPTLLLDPSKLDEVDRWADTVENEVSARKLSAPVWLDETGNAMCGGAAGISDRYVSTLWWGDQLGKIARRGEQVTFRQTLSGSDYGLLDDETLEPRPDYWVSILWKKLMGTRVLDFKTNGSSSLRGYAHCTPGSKNGSVSIVLINLDQAQAESVDLSALGNGQILSYELTSSALDSKSISLNGTELQLEESKQGDKQLPPLEPTSVSGPVLTVAPVSTRFLVLPDAGAAACAELPVSLSE